MKKDPSYSPGLDELAFEGRNKAYGSYDLRRKYTRYLLVSLLAGTFLFSVMVIAPFLMYYFQGADLLITADCVPVAYAGYHEDFLKGKAVVMGCPKLDDNNFYQQKLTELISKSDVKSITVLKMEVPCCGGIAMVAKQALAASGKEIPFSVVTISIGGEVVG